MMGHVVVVQLQACLGGHQHRMKQEGNDCRMKYLVQCLMMRSSVEKVSFLS